MNDNPWRAGLDDEAARVRAERYAAAFDRRAAAGQDVHGEATLVDTLLAPGSIVLDAGCGTGRIAARLAELGHRPLGVDLDGAMVAQARARHPDLTWWTLDLAELRPEVLQTPALDAVVAAGNVMPLLTPGTEIEVVTRLAALLAPGGLLVAGFGLDDAHLPPSAPAGARFRSLAAYDDACASADLVLRDRWATWGGESYAGGGYAVSVHRRG